jgi:hypothetical protein
MVDPERGELRERMTDHPRDPIPQFVALGAGST